MRMPRSACSIREVSTPSCSWIERDSERCRVPNRSAASTSSGSVPIAAKASRGFMASRVASVPSAKTALSSSRKDARPVRNRTRSTSCTARESSCPVSAVSWKAKESAESRSWIALRRS